MKASAPPALHPFIDAADKAAEFARDMRDNSNVWEIDPEPHNAPGQLMAQIENLIAAMLSALPAQMPPRMIARLNHHINGFYIYLDQEPVGLSAARGCVGLLADELDQLQADIVRLVEPSAQTTQKKQKEPPTR